MQSNGKIAEMKYAIENQNQKNSRKIFFMWEVANSPKFEIYEKDDKLEKLQNQANIKI